MRAQDAKKAKAVKPPANLPPKHDPPDQPFRRAPMGLAGRSVHIPLATNFHVAFDTELLRVHTAWEGETLNLFGPPHHGSAERWLCTVTGTTLWGNPPVLPWQVTDVVGKRVVDVSFRHRFRGISTKGGVSLLYELTPRESQTIRIHESPRLEHIGETPVFVRRFEISAAEETLEFLAHSEAGRGLDLPKTSAATILQREKDFLLVAARGRPVLAWKTSIAPADYTLELIVENKSEPQIEQRKIQREEARAFLSIPPHAADIAFEICTVVCKSREEAEQLVPKLVPVRVAPSRMEFITNNEKDTNAPPAKIIEGDKSFAAFGQGDEFYKLERFPLPASADLKVTGMDWLPNGDLAVATWPGDVWIVQGAGCEPGGLKVVNGQIYVVQKCELTRLVDTDGNGEADYFECVSQGWGFIGNYHHFAFGPMLDKDGNLVMVLDGQRGLYDVPFMGWAVRVKPDGSDFEGFCRGLRAPNGFGTFGPDRDLFATDNQGQWLGACKLIHLHDDRFYGFPSATPAPEDEFREPKSFSPPAVWFPYKMVRSASGITTIEDERFGPWKGQMLVADFQNSVVVRVALEKVNGEWQGCVWPLLKGFGSGVNRLAMGADGRLYAGGGKGGHWAGALGPRMYSLDRVAWTGKVPFEVKEVHATASGFELDFTQPVDDKAAGNPDSYDVAQYTYIYHAIYGSPEIDHDGKKDSATAIKITKAAVSPDRLKVQLTLEGWKPGYVTLVRGLDVKSAEGKPLWHDTFYYTLNQIPK
ncbi:MAG: hypothetical protein HY300_05520 [Verrucomicrobia bacterium]|nr:hypothetical protein [Verrucomicrobiota bacterium]